MKTIILAIALSAARAIALTFADPSIDAKSTAPPPFQFDPWTHGAVGIAKDGRTLGSEGNDCWVWSVGPSAFVWARHVSPQPDAAIVYRGVRYPLISTTPIGSDIVIGVIDGKTPTWGAVWRGFGMVTNRVPSGWPPGFGMPAEVEKVTPVSIADAQIVAISGGPGGVLRSNELCVGSDPRPPAKRWASAIGCSVGIVGMSQLDALKRMGSTFEYDIVGPEFSIPFLSGSDRSNPGAWTGDSGGGVFIKTADGWRLVGLMHSGGSCKGNSIDGGIVAEAAFLKPELWKGIGKAGNESTYAWIRQHLADAPSYTATPPTPPVAPVQTPIQPVAPVTITNTVTVTLTNWVTVGISNPLTFQQRAIIQQARDALQRVVDVLGK